MKGRFTVAGASLTTIAALAVAACGGSSGGGGSASTAGSNVGKLTNKPITLTFLWFDWPPAHALEALGKEYTKVRPNVTVKVDVVPNANWHDAIFTQFAAHKTNFDMPILDSQNIGEAVTNGSLVDLTDFVKKNVPVNQYNPYFFAAYGMYPQSQTGQPSPGAKTYGVPLMGDTWTLVYRKDLIKTPPATWDEMLSDAKTCQQQHPGMSGLAFHQAGTADAAAETFNTVDWILGGEIWDPAKRQIQGVVNDATGQQAMNMIVNQMKPLAPKGSSNWFIDEVNAAINQGKVCMGLQWIGGLGVLDPKSSTLGKTKAQILDKLGFAPLPTGKTNAVPLGGMGMHISKYIPADHIAEAENFIKWFQSADVQKKWAELGGVPGRKDVLASPEFLNANPANKVFAESINRVKDFWNLPEYAKLVNVESTNVNAAISGTETPSAALNKIATDQQAILDADK
jgi:multiple sugar transport system substrate-binding protein